MKLEKYGIKMMIDAYMQCVKAPNIELHLYGDGDMVPYIKKCCSEDCSIVYYGSCQNSEIVDGLRVASPLALIGLKERAFLNLLSDREQGKKVNTRDITKHRNDVLKLAAIITPGPYSCSEGIFVTNRDYVEHIRTMLPSQALQDALGVGDEEVADLVETLDKLFRVEE